MEEERRGFLDRSDPKIKGKNIMEQWLQVNEIKIRNNLI